MIMVKNWMILGDEAFDSKHEPIGVIELTSEELNDWHNVAWKRFAHTVNTNEKVREMVFNSNYMYLGAVFSKKSGVTHEDIEGFADYFYHNIEDLEYLTVDVSYNTNCDDGTIILVFSDYDEAKVNRLMPSMLLYIRGNMMVPVNLQSCCYLS